MDHVAIMKKSWGMIPKILLGAKTIESRWSKTKSIPWGRVKKGDVIYFKNSGEPVSVKNHVERVESHENLTPKIINKLLNTYGGRIGVEDKKLKGFYEMVKDKKYCTLIFINNPNKTKPFEIDKSGFGSMSAWICTKQIQAITRKD